MDTSTHVVLCPTYATKPLGLVLTEIPVLQLMGALYMGNKVVFKTDSKVFACGI